MSRTRRGKIVIVTFAAMAVLSSASATTILAAGNSTTVRAGNLVLQAEGVISPEALPKNKMAPIRLHARGSVETADGSHVPPAKTVHLRIDRHYRIDSAGLPSCTVGKISASVPAYAMKVCGSALVGKGYATAQVEFPDSNPFSARGRMLAFNGPSVGGYPEQLDYIYVDVPAPTTLVVVAKFSKDSGKYAYRVSVTIPELAGGYGALTGFDLKFGRKWTYRGQRHSYLSAECPDGHFFDQIEAAFGDGTDLKGTLVNGCRSRG